MTERVGLSSQTNMLAEEALKKLENDYNKHMPRQTLTRDESLLMDKKSLQSLAARPSLFNANRQSFALN